METLPEVKIEVNKWAKANVAGISCDSVAVHLRENIVPKIYRTYLDDCGISEEQISMENILQIYGLKYNSHTTTWHWMKAVIFKYCDRKKNYFCDRYEDESNVEYRKEFIEDYLNHEKRMYHWVHVEEHVAIELEKKTELVEDIGIKFDKNKKKFREYHVDTHPMFASLEKHMSIQVQPATRPLMIIGQDESVFKQYFFSKNVGLGLVVSPNSFPKVMDIAE